MTPETSALAAKKPTSIVGATPTKKFITAAIKQGQPRTMSSAQLGGASVRRVNSPIVVKTLIDDFGAKVPDLSVAGK